MATVTTLARRYVAERTARRELTGASPIDISYQLHAFARIIDNPDAGTLRRRHIVRWLDARPHVSDGTIRCQLSIVRNFCRWLVENGHTPTDPTAGIRGPDEPHRLPRSLSPDEVAAVLLACPDQRARVMCLLAVQEGLRCKEVADLQLGDVDFAERWIFVQKGKGGRQRVVALSDETADAIAAYLAEHPAGSGPLIRSYSEPSRPITRQYVSTLISRWFRAAGVKKSRYDGKSAHAFRHTMATDMVRNGAPLPAVQAALGHSSLAWTTIYVRARAEDVREAMGGRRYGPTARSKVTTTPSS